MPYKFIHIAADHREDALPFDNMKAFREWASEHLIGAVVVQGTKVLDENNEEIGKLTYVKPKGTPPTFVQPQVDGPSLDEVLADIDALELDDEEEPEIGAARRAGIPLLDEPVTAIQNADGAYGTSDPEVTPRRRERRTSTPRHARMSHKNCGHAISGEAGKIARAECRARRRAEAAA